MGSWFRENIIVNPWFNPLGAAINTINQKKQNAALQEQVTQLTSSQQAAADSIADTNVTAKTVKDKSSGMSGTTIAVIVGVFIMVLLIVVLLLKRRG